MNKIPQSFNDKVDLSLLFFTFFLAFSGYYLFLMIISNMGFAEISRLLTIPVRILVLFSLAILYLRRPKIRLDKFLSLFLIFSFFYYLRILIEFFNNPLIYHISVVEFFLYFTSFVFIPFLLISQLFLNNMSFNIIFKAITSSTLLLGLLSYFFYKNFLGQVGRIFVVMGVQDNFFSPLFLSYCGALGIGLGIVFLMTNKGLARKTKINLILLIGVSFVPFLLGASRGSLLAIILPFFFLTISISNKNKRITIIVAMIITSSLIVYSADYFSSSVIERFLSIKNDMEMGKSSAIRLLFWKSSVLQFLENPIFGNSLECTFAKFYPHNIYLEVLLSTGLVGGIPFFILQFNAFRIIIKIIKYTPKYSWLAALFLQSFSQNMFSGSIYSSSWYFISLALIFVYDRSIFKNSHKQILRYSK